jgi:hypothetical protein
MLYQAAVAVRGVAGPVTRRSLTPGVNQQNAITARVIGAAIRAVEVGIAGAVAAGGDGEGDRRPSCELGDERVDGG